MYLLRTLPVGLPRPAAFEAGGRLKLDKTLACVEKTFASHPDTVAAWQRWAALAPVDDSADTYVERLQREGGDMHIPLRDIFLACPRLAARLSQSGTASMLKAGAAPALSAKDRLPICRSGQSVVSICNRHPEEARILIDPRVTASAGARAALYQLQNVDYTAKAFTNAKLEALCRKRCIKHTGAKNELIRRLIDWDVKEIYDRFDISLSQGLPSFV